MLGPVCLNLGSPLLGAPGMCDKHVSCPSIHKLGLLLVIEERNLRRPRFACPKFTAPQPHPRPQGCNHTPLILLTFVIPQQGPTLQVLVLSLSHGTKTSTLRAANLKKRLGELQTPVPANVALGLEAFTTLDPRPTVSPHTLDLLSRRLQGQSTTTS